MVFGISGFQIVLSTFGVYFLAGLAFPLLVVYRHMSQVSSPSRCFAVRCPLHVLQAHVSRAAAGLKLLRRLQEITATSGSLRQNNRISRSESLPSCLPAFLPSLCYLSVRSHRCQGHGRGCTAAAWDWPRTRVHELHRCCAAAAPPHGLEDLCTKVSKRISC